MKITEQELRKIIMEELENEIKSLNEDDGLAAYLFGDGPEAQRLAGEREGNQKRAAEAKARQDRKNGVEDAKKTSNPKEPGNKDYMRGFLRSRLTVLEKMIKEAVAFKKEKYGRSLNPFKGISAVFKGSEARQLLNKIDNMKEERRIIEKAFAKIEDGIFDDSAWMEKYGK
tara:strand:- start:2494 stop:3006 length:513 start_codon:yes stop_codon:yes gene_type:complete